MSDEEKKPEAVLEGQEAVAPKNPEPGKCPTCGRDLVGDKAS